MNRFKYYSVLLLTLLLTNTSCKNNNTKQGSTITTENITYRNLSQEFKEYWYVGEAEITSYTLQQARYGEIRNGHAALIYVTEDFLPEEQVKANAQDSDNISVLKLNATKKFNTGIYPYSIMQSTFYPLSTVEHATKISCSVQEWCGQTYTQLNTRKAFEINSHSYFQGEADKSYTIEKAILENELWTQLRVNPKELPVGDVEIIPSFEFLSLKHIELKPYQANTSLTATSYTIEYPELDRTLTINFNKNTPFEVLGWTETFKSGTEILTTKATKLNTIKSPYWNKNSNRDSILRETLKLK
ncbi:septum formation inhibitor Maf [Pontimicrobium aquaticum]|uniref:Septum formation inhibitor Maf n=1 Tax=Pontimicrobium aquaticum TaxID=2565367 RepID=A0A4U0EVD4_9FLAO|nr:septum formation inhibitor Maf [Pontimicrobium aquaticum]TJY35825.1 septum formation inhibitor Maf [Pontimicrobium aquaticum]